MKVKFKSLIFFLILLTGIFTASAQEKILSENEFKEISARAEQNLKGKTYRLTRTEEVFSDRSANAESVNIKINEYVQPDKWREVVEISSTSKKSRIERIWDGKNLYERENDGEWKKFSGGGGIGGSIKSGRITTIYKFIEKSVLNNQPVNIYEVEQNRKATKLTQTGIYEVHYVERTKYWISEDGYFLKKVSENEIVGSKSLIRETWIYDYNPNIKIEAPIIKEK
jgi:hypothetical protein